MNLRVVSCLLYLLVFILVTAVSVVLALGHRTKRGGTNGKREDLARLHKRSATCAVWLYACIGVAGKFVLEPLLRLKTDPLLIAHLLLIAVFGILTIVLRYIMPGLNENLAPEYRRRQEKAHGYLGWLWGAAGYAISITGFFLARRI